MYIYIYIHIHIARGPLTHTHTRAHMYLCVYMYEHTLMCTHASNCGYRARDDTANVPSPRFQVIPFSDPSAGPWRTIMDDHFSIESHGDLGFLL